VNFYGGSDSSSAVSVLQGKVNDEAAVFGLILPSPVVPYWPINAHG
jgi:hypothetical protein